jgi:activator of HSP90 ATPase
MKDVLMGWEHSKDVERKRAYEMLTGKSIGKLSLGKDRKIILNWVSGSQNVKMAHSNSL